MSAKRHPHRVRPTFDVLDARCSPSALGVSRLPEAPAHHQPTLVRRHGHLILVDHQGPGAHRRRHRGGSAAEQQREKELEKQHEKELEQEAEAEKETGDTPGQGGTSGQAAR